MEVHPVRLTVADDLRRSRLTVFFRLLLSIPHIVWFGLWTYAVSAVAFVGWLCALVQGRLPEWAHRFLGAYIRYGLQLGAYLHLAANPFPGFIGDSGYPVEVTIPPPEQQPRLTIFFRGLLAFPALLVAGALAGFAQGGFTYSWIFFGGGAAGAAALLGWFAALALGRMPTGLRDLAAYGLGYAAQFYAYAFLLTPRYPNSDPEGLGPEWSLPNHPVRLELSDDGRRSRLTVLFRYLLTLPHIVWLTLWSVAASVAALLNWFVTLFRGRPAAPLHRFLAAFLHYNAQVSAFLYLVTNPFPGFTGARTYPFRITLPGPEPQSRWLTLFRLFLALPAFVVVAGLSSTLLVAAFLGWFAALVTGRMPTGLRNVGAISLRYLIQTYAYTLLLTDRYPYASPALRAPAAPEPEAAA